MHILHVLPAYFDASVTKLQTMLTIPIGSRVASDGEFGTVLYVGEVNSTPGIWIGIEWDNPNRGKHDGSHKGKRYFVTSHPTSGSFVRSTKLNFGKSFLDALCERYQDDKKKALDENTMCLPQKYGPKRPVEFVGLEKITHKQSQLHQLTEIDLGGSLVNGILGDDSNELATLIPNVTILDLSHNLLSSWNSVADIAQHLPRLAVLNLSNNRLSAPENPSELSSAFRNLKTLVLSKQSYDWSQVQKQCQYDYATYETRVTESLLDRVVYLFGSIYWQLLENKVFRTVDDIDFITSGVSAYAVMRCAVMWPNIEYLDLWSNKITELTEVSSEIFANLSFLNISSNTIGSWEEVCKLGTLNRLETLIVEDADIPSISFPSMDPYSGITHLFRNLHSLSLVNNRLSTWKDISELNKLQHLMDLRIKGNPILSAEKPETSHQFVIAKLGSLKRLNRLEITRTERRGAELDYLKRYCKEWLQNGGSRDPELNNPSREFLDEHPSYLRLLKEYGAPEDSELRKDEPVLLKNDLTSMEFYCPSKPNIKITRKLPDTMTVTKLKILVCRLFKLKVRNLTLKVMSSKENDPEIEMDDMREISFYSLREGDKICIQENL